ncbi:MAG: methionine--tRNA ligase subunit beta [Phycisphaerales bacterium]|nr:methionine--tRNA ligase subunit beta [Phycisphaerales bacterium]
MPDPTPVNATPSPAPAAPLPTPAGAEAKPQITFDEFAKIDLRIAKVIKAEFHPSADKLLKIQVDDGSGTPRQICAGIRGAYAPEELIGKSIVIVANLAPRMLRGEESRGMLLAASDVPKDAAPGIPRKVIVLTPMTDIAPGSIVT